MQASVRLPSARRGNADWRHVNRMLTDQAPEYFQKPWRINDKLGSSELHLNFYDRDEVNRDESLKIP